MKIENHSLEGENISNEGSQTVRTLKKIVSFLIISSMLLSDTAFAMRRGSWSGPENGFHSGENGVSRKHPPKRRGSWASFSHLPDHANGTSQQNGIGKKLPSTLGLIPKLVSEVQNGVSRTNGIIHLDEDEKVGGEFLSSDSSDTEETTVTITSPDRSTDKSHSLPSSLDISKELEKSPLGGFQKVEDLEGSESLLVPNGSGVNPLALVLVDSHRLRENGVVSSYTSKKKDRPTERKDKLTEKTPLLEAHVNGHLSSKGSIQIQKLDDPEHGTSLKEFARDLVVLVSSRDKRGSNSLLDEEIIPINGSRNVEEGRGHDPRDFFGRIQNLDPRKDIDRQVLAFLVYAKKHIVDGKFTLRQGLLGGIGGTLIGVGVGNAMPPIFAYGLSTVGHRFNYELNWDPTIAHTFITHTAITLGIDSISRNVMIIGDLAGPSMEEFSLPGLKLKYRKVQIDPRKGALILVYLGAGLAALLPVYYLWDVEEKNIKWAEENGEGQYKAKCLAFFWCLAPTLWLDSLFTNGRAAKEWVDEKFKNWAVRRAFSDRFSPESGLRQQELKRFKDLALLFKYAPAEYIDDLYEQVLVKGFKIKKNGIDIPEETIKSGDALRTLKVLRSIHADSQLPEEVKETWKHVVSEICGWGIPIAATVGRSLVFYTIISHLLGDIGLGNEAANTTLSVIFGGIIASFFQGKVEKDTVKEGVYDLLNGEETEGDASHNCFRSGFRKVGKGYNYLQGAWNTFPYILVGIAATSGWPVAIQIATLLFFGVADMFNNTMSFHESYGGVFNGAESLLSYGYATTSYKRNKLIRLVRRYRAAYETMAPNVMMKVDALLSDEGRNGLLEHYEGEVPPTFSLIKKKKKKDTGEDSNNSEESLSD